jgi:hypothetical protein
MARNIQIAIIAGDEFRRVGDALREIDASLPGEFRKELRDAAKPFAQEVKARVRRLPTPRHAGHTGLRARVARGVRVQAKLGRNSGVRIVTSMDRRNEAIIPRGLDSRTKLRGWLHPVFGHGPMVLQEGGSWFIEPLSEKRPQLVKVLLHVLNDAAQRVERAGGRL